MKITFLMYVVILLNLTIVKVTYQSIDDALCTLKYLIFSDDFLDQSIKNTYSFMIQKNDDKNSINNSIIYLILTY